MNVTKSLDSWINYLDLFNIEWAIEDGSLRFYCLSSPHWEFFFTGYDEDNEDRIIIHPNTPFDEEVIEYTKKVLY